MQLNSLIVILTILLSVHITQCDLPVHCLARDIAGVWRLHVETSDSFTQKACGHMLPDRNTDHLNEKRDKSLETQIIEVNLVLPDIVRDSENKDIGNWTMVYDEGFSIEFSGFSFLAFSKYIISEGTNPQDTDDEQSTGYLSVCSETFKGWYRMNSKWGCFYGEKKDEPIGKDKYIDNSLLFKGQQGLKIVQRNDFKANYSGIENTSENTKSNMSLFDRFQNNLKLYEMPHDEFLKDNNTKKDSELFEPDFSFIQLVNDETSKLPWKARSTDFFKSKTKGQMKKLIGMTKFKQIKFRMAAPMNSSFAAPLKLTANENSFLQINFKAKLKLRKGSIHAPVRISNCIGFNDDGLPKCFDWRNMSNVNYDTPIKSQGDCGSCYAEAVISAVESRIRIKSKNQLRPILSMTNMISCSRYNQGCNGGYPWLVGKHGKEFGFAEATCQGNTEFDSKCDASCLSEEFSGAKNKGRLWMIKDFGYIGRKYYGSTTEKAMMDEIYKNGPITIAFNAAPDLYYYSNGVFITNPKEAYSQDNFRRDISPWEFTNHAVVCVGWGETEHEGQQLKYWIFKNSWGEDWGEGGYFRMLRGFDLGAVENQAVYVDPIV